MSWGRAKPSLRVNTLQTKRTLRFVQFDLGGFFKVLTICNFIFLFFSIFDIFLQFTDGHKHRLLFQHQHFIAPCKKTNGPLGSLTLLLLPYLPPNVDMNNSVQGEM